MACNCNKEQLKRPDEACIFCAHKHIATARALYELESGYLDVNKSYAIAQLILASWHLQSDHLDLARLCRECWLKIEKRQNCHPLLAHLQTTLWQLVISTSDSSPA